MSRKNEVQHLANSAFLPSTLIDIHSISFDRLHNVLAVVLQTETLVSLFDTKQHRLASSPTADGLYYFAGRQEETAGIVHFVHSALSRRSEVRTLQFNNNRMADTYAPSTTAYNGVSSEEVRRVFKAAHVRRFSRPDANTIVEITGTSLDLGIVSAIVEGALRVLPPDKSTDGQERQKQEMALKAAYAFRAENASVNSVRRIHPALLDER